MYSTLVILAAGFAAGILNAIAGGGTFLTFPALVWAGAPAVSANATATLSALPGYLSSAWALRNHIRAEGALRLASVMLCASLGGLLGAGLLLLTPDKAFSALVPWLLLLATVAFAAGPYLLAQLRRRGAPAAGPTISAAALVAVSLYGGYFNGGLGIMLLAVFGLLGFSDLHGMNGLKNLLSAIPSIVAVATYIAAGLISWPAALLMAPATTAGGYLGAWLAQRIQNIRLLRGGITVIGVAMTVAFFLT